MLQLTDLLGTGDAKANELIAKFISKRILEIAEPLKDDEWMLARFFPKSYPRHKRKAAFSDLIALLKSEKTYIPALILEYVMYELIRYGIEQCEACNTSTTIKMQQEDREYVFSILKQECEKMIADEECGENEDPCELTENMMSDLEDLERCVESCFWDYDFKLLDQMSEKEIFYSELNKILGIGTKKSIIYQPGTVTY